MAFEPLRFLHAANVRLDQPIGGDAGFAPHFASTLIDAPRIAFERLIAAAVEQRIDFVLLVGNSFLEGDRSLAARLAVLDGLKRLAQEKIRVVVLPGQLDPADAWQQIDDLPKNVVVLDSSKKPSVTIKRHDRPIATIGPSLWASERKTPRQP